VLKHDDFSSPNKPGGKQDEEEGVVAMSSRCSVAVVRVAAADGPSGREPVAKVIKKLFSLLLAFWKLKTTFLLPNFLSHVLLSYFNWISWPPFLINLLISHLIKYGIFPPHCVYEFLCLSK
jgi:hypothetical protein